MTNTNPRNDIDGTRLARLGKAYEHALRNAVNAKPDAYVFTVDKVPAMAQRMEGAFATGHYVHDGACVQAAAKACGLVARGGGVVTRRAIEAFLRGE